MILFRSRSLLALSLGHFTIDIYSSLLPVMFPFLVDSLHLTYTQVGFLITLFTFTSSLTQPLFGFLADRLQMRRLGAMALLWMATFVVLAAYSRDYLSLAFLVALAGLGTAAFHPQAWGSASTAASQQPNTSSLAIFGSSGGAGYALGPLLGGALFAATGLEGAAILMILALATAPILLFFSPLPRPLPEARTKTRSQGEGPLIWFILPLIGLIVLLPWASRSLSTYLPLLYVHKGYSIITASQVLFLLLLAEAFGTFLGGMVADRWGYKRVIVMTLALASPFYYLFLHGPAFSLLPFVLLLGLCLGATSPMTMGLVQSLLPASRATVSGLALGSSFVAGGVGAGITGVIADRLGLMKGLDLLIILPLIASFLCLLLPAQSPFVSQEEVS